MNLYKLWQDDNDDYDTYDSAVVCAESEDEAKSIADAEFDSEPIYGSWVSKDKVRCQLIGYAVSGTKKVSLLLHLMPDEYREDLEEGERIWIIITGELQSW